MVLTGTKRSRPTSMRARALEDLDRRAHRGLDLDHLGRGRVGRVDGLDVADQRQAEDAVRARRGRRVIARRSNQRLLVEQNRCRSRSASAFWSSGEVWAVSRSTIRPSDLRRAKWPPLRSDGGTAYGLDRERRTGRRRTSRRPRVGDRAEVVGVGDEDPLVALVDQRLEQTGAAQRGVEVAVAGRAPLEVGVPREADRRAGRRRAAWARGSAGTRAAARRPGGRRSGRARPGCRSRCGSCS